MEASLTINETPGDKAPQEAKRPDVVVPIPAGVYLEPDEEEGRPEKGETVAIPLKRLGLLDIYLASDAQALDSNVYSPLLEGRLSKDEFVDIVSHLNEEVREQVGGQVKKGWIYTTLVLISLWVLVSIWHGAKAFQHHNANLLDFLPMPVFIGFMIFLIKKTNNRRTAQNISRTVANACKQLNDKYMKRGLQFRYVYDRVDAESTTNYLEIEIVPVPEP